MQAVSKESPQKTTIKPNLTKRFIKYSGNFSKTMFFGEIFSSIKYYKKIPGNQLKFSVKAARTQGKSIYFYKRSVKLIQYRVRRGKSLV
jgi:hypothetical protein